MTTVTQAPHRASIGRLIGVLALLLAIIGLFSYGAFVVAAPFGWLAHPQSRVAVFLGGAIIGELAAFGALIWLLRRRGLSLRALGLGRRTNWRGVVVALLVAGVYCAVTARNPAVGSHLLEYIPLKLLAVVAALVAGLVEETIFRGYVMTTLETMRHRPVTQVVVSGVCFAIAHFYAFVSPLTLLVTFGMTFALGAGLAVAYLVGNRSLTPAIIGHALVDLVIEPWLLLGFFTGAL
jgi:membrane protease YdiL (CAAX protease family)